MKASQNVIYTSNIAPNVTLEELTEFFSCCGPLTAIELVKDETRPDGFQKAKVTFRSWSSCTTAELLSGSVFYNSPLVITLESTIDTQEQQHEQQTEPVTEETEQPEEWKSVKSIGVVIGKGFVVGQRTIDYLIEYDEKKKISSTVVAKVQDIDERTRFSESVGEWAAKVKAKWLEIDAKHHISAKSEEMLVKGTEFIKSTDHRFRVTEKVDTAAKVISDKAKESGLVTQINAIQSHAQNVIHTELAQPTAHATAPTTTATEIPTHFGDINEHTHTHNTTDVVADTAPPQKTV
eukprot:c16259_g1_i1.p1 GENE.c16259_g1_i1~~c16259_g1_i1.p1  ORF type:complete len:307 (-),score=90.83 c16259_g1_i1:94-972(-)